MTFRELCAECHQGRDTNCVRGRRLGRARSGEAVGPMFVACSSVPCDPGFQLTMFGSTKRRRVVPLTICWLRSVEALRSPPNFRSWGCRTEHIRNGSSH